MELFRQRAERARDGFEAGYADVAAICALLERLPLAIELAAARAAVLETSALLEQLERRLPLLGGGTSDVPELERTLRATIAWSYELLSPDERALFLGLSGCVAASELAAAGAAADAGLLQALVETRLLRQHRGRLTMLGTIRETARRFVAATVTSLTSATSEQLNPHR